MVAPHHTNTTPRRPLCKKSLRNVQRYTGTKAASRSKINRNQRILAVTTARRCRDLFQHGRLTQRLHSKQALGTPLVRPAAPRKSSRLHPFLHGEQSVEPSSGFPNRPMLRLREHQGQTLLRTSFLCQLHVLLPQLIVNDGNHRLV